MTSNHIAKVFNAALNPPINDQFTALEAKIAARLLWLKRSWAIRFGIQRARAL